MRAGRGGADEPDGPAARAPLGRQPGAPRLVAAALLAGRAVGAVCGGPAGHLPPPLAAPAEVRAARHRCAVLKAAVARLGGVPWRPAWGCRLPQAAPRPVHVPHRTVLPPSPRPATRAQPAARQPRRPLRTHVALSAALPQVDAGAGGPRLHQVGAVGSHPPRPVPARLLRRAGAAALAGGLRALWHPLTRLLTSAGSMIEQNRRCVLRLRQRPCAALDALAHARPLCRDGAAAPHAPCLPAALPVRLDHLLCCPHRCCCRSSLQAPAHALPFTEAAVRQAFGFGVADLFSSFEPQPVASGSIGQIHRAVLSDTGARLTGMEPGGQPRGGAAVLAALGGARQPGAWLRRPWRPAGGGGQRRSCQKLPRWHAPSVARPDA